MILFKVKAHRENSLLALLERELRMFYHRENHTIANYLFLYWIIAVGILGLLLIAELFFK